MVTCQNCGATIDIGDIFCYECGFNLRTTSIVKQAKEKIDIQLDTNTLTRYTQLEEQLADLRTIPDELEQQRAYLNNLTQNFNNTQRRWEALIEQREKEYLDVEKLEKLSVTSLMARVKGTKAQQLEKEKVEYLTVLNKEEAARRECQKLEDVITQTKGQVNELEDLLNAKNKLEKELETLIHQVCEGVPDPIEDAIEQRLAILEDQIGPITNNRSRVFRAKNHLDHAITDMNRALESLRSASGFSTWDLLGGGLIADSIKHSRMSEARNSVHNAHSNIQRAIQEYPEIRGSLSSAYVEDISFFWDGFMDNIFSDIAARDKIHRSMESVRQALSDASNANRWLDNKLRNFNQQFTDLNSKIEETRKELLEERKRMINEAIKK
ncbi:MAG: zinc ribbon domain-containing protein [Promethearchaeota archaeon]